MTPEEDRRYSTVRTRAIITVLLGSIAVAAGVDRAFPGLARGGWREGVVGLAVIVQMICLFLIPDRIALWDMQTRRRRRDKQL